MVSHHDGVAGKIKDLDADRRAPRSVEVKSHKIASSQVHLAPQVQVYVIRGWWTADRLPEVRGRTRQLVTDFVGGLPEAIALASHKRRYLARCIKNRF